MNAHDRKVLGVVYEALNEISSPPRSGSASVAVNALVKYARRADAVVWPAMLALSELRFGDPDRTALDHAQAALEAAKT